MAVYFMRLEGGVHTLLAVYIIYIYKYAVCGCPHQAKQELVSLIWENINMQL